MKCEAGVSAGVRERYEDRRVFRGREKLSIIPERPRNPLFSDASAIVQQQDLEVVLKQSKGRA